MREEMTRAGKGGKLVCVGCGAPVGHNSLKYTREMCLRCYARMLNDQPVGDQRDADTHARTPPAEDEEQ